MLCFDDLENWVTTDRESSMRLIGKLKERVGEKAFTAYQIFLIVFSMG